MTAPTAQPAGSKPRVVHLVKWLPRGGIETWLTHLFTHASGEVQHEVLVMQDEIGAYERVVRAAGVPIHVVPMTSRLGWFGQLYRFLKHEGPFAVFHAHVDSIVSGPALVAARLAGVPVRIIHNHSARSVGSDYQALRYKLREGFGNAIARGASTRLIGISEMTMQHLAGREWRRRGDGSVLLYGFDFATFHDAPARAEQLRQELDIAPGINVIGHVGRFDPVKNHGFLLETFAALTKRLPNSVLVLIGRGPLQPKYEGRARALGIANKVRFVGGTDDVASYMSLFDAFVFPSFSEGLGIVLLEAQAAGTRIVMAENMPAEVVVIPQLVSKLALEVGPQKWADKAAETLGLPRADRPAALAAVEASAFGMERCVRDLDEIYFKELAAQA